MAKYLTTQQYMLAEDSIPGLTAIPQNIISRTIGRAESMIDSFVGFDARLGGFEPHTAWYQTKFDEKTLRIPTPNYPAPIRQIARYRIHVSNQSNGQPFYANINPGDCVINVWGGYIEIVPLQAVTYSLTPFMMGLGLRPPLVLVDFDAGFYLASFGEILEEQYDDLTHYRAARGFWTSTVNLAPTLLPNTPFPTPPNVYVGGVLQATNTYSIDYTEGVITFNAPLTLAAGNVRPVVTADYTYQIPDPIREATITQTTYLLVQRNLNLMGLGGIEVARSRDQQIKRHIRTSADSSAKDEPALDPYAMQLLEPYQYIPIG